MERVPAVEINVRIIQKSIIIEFVYSQEPPFGGFLIDDRDMHNIQGDKSRGYSCMILYIQYSIIQF